MGSLPLDISRRDVLRGLAAGIGLAGAGATLGGGRSSSAWAAQAPARRAGVLLAPGTRPDPSRPEGIDTLPQIEHVVIYMQENHSFDNYLGMLGRGDGFTLVSGQPTNTNPDLNGQPVSVFHALSTCDHSHGASQSWNASHLSWNGGAMDGFIRAASGGTGSMGYYDQADLPFYSGLARTFPLCDRWFSSVLGQTFPNRRYVQAATSMGIVSTDVKEVLATPSAPNGVIWERLSAHGITWADYAIDLADILLFPDFAKSHGDHIKKYPDFLHDCGKGTLPQVSIISPGVSMFSEEGPLDSQNGEAYSSAIVRAVMQGPAWERSVMFFTYDEHGGYYDHVPPPPAPAPDSIPPRVHVPPDEPGGFDRYGVRVPGIVISPFAKRNYISHVVHDHTSILKFIETKFNLGALTYRDANADDLVDTLDFANPGFIDPPTLPLPALTTHESTCEPIALPAQPLAAAARPAPPPTTAPGPVRRPATDSSSSVVLPAVAVGAVAVVSGAAALTVHQRNKRRTASEAEREAASEAAREAAREAFGDGGGQP